jgi:hypothetical protein
LVVTHAGIRSIGIVRIEAGPTGGISTFQCVLEGGKVECWHRELSHSFPSYDARSRRKPDCAH